MDNIYKRISNIRERIEEKIFSSIYEYFEENGLNVTRENFIIALKEKNLVENNSYCKYVYFIKKYLYKKKVCK
ncbi:MAG: hypothetical protein PHH06_01350 [Candidatus Gracilibacteria bacterium]|nr:hypothetical protein [Candidatus Gracilibacteria bacterium]